MRRAFSIFLGFLIVLGFSGYAQVTNPVYHEEVSIGGGAGDTGTDLESDGDINSDGDITAASVDADAYTLSTVSLDLKHLDSVSPTLSASEGQVLTYLSGVWNVSSGLGGFDESSAYTITGLWVWDDDTPITFGTEAATLVKIVYNATDNKLEFTDNAGAEQVTITDIGDLWINNDLDLEGILTAGSGSTVLTNAAGEILGAALESAIAGSGLTLTAGVLSNDISDLEDLGNVDITGLADGYVAVYNSVSGNWEVEAKTTTTATLADMTDVTISGVADNDFLIYDSVSGDWLNVNEPTFLDNQRLIFGTSLNFEIDYDSTDSMLQIKDPGSADLVTIEDLGTVAQLTVDQIDTSDIDLGDNDTIGFNAEWYMYSDTATDKWILEDDLGTEVFSVEDQSGFFVTYFSNLYAETAIITTEIELGGNYKIAISGSDLEIQDSDLSNPFLRVTDDGSTGTTTIEGDLVSSQGDWYVTDGNALYFQYPAVDHFYLAHDGSGIEWYDTSGNPLTKVTDLGTTGDLESTGSMTTPIYYAGEDGVTDGAGYFYGDSLTTGGHVSFYPGNSNDTTTNYYGVGVLETEDFGISADGVIKVSVDGTTGAVSILDDFYLSTYQFDLTAIADNYIWVYNAASGNFELEAQSGGGGVDLDLDTDELILFGDGDEFQMGYYTAGDLIVKDPGGAEMFKIRDTGSGSTIFFDKIDTTNARLEVEGGTQDELLRLVNNTAGTNGFRVRVATDLNPDIFIDSASDGVLTVENDDATGLMNLAVEGVLSSSDAASWNTIAGDLSIGTNNLYAFWGNSTTYAMGMFNSSYGKYGPVTDYSFKLKMSNTNSRGWVMGAVTVAPTHAFSVDGDHAHAGYFQSYGDIYLYKRMSMGSATHTYSSTTLTPADSFNYVNPNGADRNIYTITGTLHGQILIMTNPNSYHYRFHDKSGSGTNIQNISSTYYDLHTQDSIGYVYDATSANWCMMWFANN